MTADLAPCTARMAALIEGITDDQLGAPTPCDVTLDAVLAHIHGVAIVFAGAALRDEAMSSRSAQADATLLVDDWRTRIPADLARLAEVWRDPDAWAGMTKAGGGDMPAEVAGLIALDEVVVHGWDIALATGQSYHCDLPTLEAAYGFVAGFAEPGMEAQREGLFGPVIDVPEDAPLLHRLLGLTGRDPAWSPS